ncbi:hypothetical protein [Haloferax sp. Atlit-12N]|uniref:hypothetical protein n=1 Tax=Haloferax sp. Atlit-12N TaxID=2077203 RepID=UPI0018F584E7|nr:hypothetical protein [Haloferax sp. Atlit-12N]
MRRRLYTLKSRDEATAVLGSDSQRNIASQSSLSGGVSVAEAVSLEPGQIRFEFFVSGEGSDYIANAFKELLNSDYQEIPFFGVTNETEFDGYYVPESGATRPLDAQVVGEIHRVNAVLSEAGTKASHLRSLAMSLSPVQNDHGNDQSASLTVPATATGVRWFNSVDGTTTSPTPTNTLSTQFGDVDVFDAAGAPTTESELVYDVPYADQGKTDCRVWDDRGVTKLDADDNVQWAKVFVTSHEFAGNIVVENGLVRLEMDGPTNTLDVSVWSDGTGQWSSLSLGASDWQLSDVDLTHIGPVAIEAQLRFENTTDGSQHAQNMRLARGATKVLFENPDNEAETTPTGLQDLLDPIASKEAQTANESLGLRKRSEVNK